ncbi:MAG: hypothetical protein ACE5EC_07015 [Phycisphaerae bacterium]
MKLPNLRLYEIQARLSVVAGLLGFICLCLLAFFVFWNIDLSEMVIRYNAEEGRGRFRPYLVLIMTAACLIIGLVAGVLGFKSLGQKRNKKQGSSWLGLLAGAIVMALAPILLMTWMTLKESIIQ